MGGEKFSPAALASLSRGSPPHGRGKADQTAEQLAQYGITPAWAGKSVLPTRHCQIPKDHPRVGGEK